MLLNLFKLLVNLLKCSLLYTLAHGIIAHVVAHAVAKIFLGGSWYMGQNVKILAMSKITNFEKFCVAQYIPL